MERQPGLAGGRRRCPCPGPRARAGRWAGGRVRSGCSGLAHRWLPVRYPWGHAFCPAAPYL